MKGEGVVCGLFLLLCVGLVQGEGDCWLQGRDVSLGEVLRRSEGSAEARIARQTFLGSHWEYEAVRKEIFPTLSFTGTLPQINRAFTKTTLPDGRETFVPQFYGDYSGSLQLTQYIPQTNTRISVSSGLERLDIYGTDRTKSYLSTPFGIGITQSLFTYNPGKWERKINPVKYQAAKQRYIQEREAAYARALALYFDLLSAQERYRNGMSERRYADTLYAMAQEKYRRQAMVESEYLQVELNVLQAEYEEESGYRIWLNAMAALKDFLQAEESGIWIMALPEWERLPEVPIEKALAEAVENNAIYREFRQRELEAQSNLVRSKSENRFSMDIYASFSLNQNAGTLARSYADLMDQEMVSIGLNIPILDWGKSKGRINMAKAQKEVALLQIEQEQRDFERELEALVLELGGQGRKVDLSRRSLEVAMKRLDTEKLLYGLSKTDFTRFRDAMLDKNACLNTYLEDLEKYWMLYYSVRRATLYDFLEGRKIEVSFDDLLRGE